MCQRDFIRVVKDTITLNISSEFCNQEDIILDIFDLFILDYINRLPLYCRPSKGDTCTYFYDNDGKYNYSEISFPEFTYIYPCLENAYMKDALEEEEFYKRVDNLVKSKLLDTIVIDALDTDTVLYRTSELYDIAREM